MLSAADDGRRITGNCILREDVTMDLTGRSAIITGASQGLGKVIATAFVEAGAGVLLTARSEELLRQVQGELKPLARPGRPVEVMRADVARREDCVAAVR